MHVHSFYYCSNCTIFFLKICVWLYTGSHSMFAESIHSVADTVNQIILAFGLHKSAKVSIIMQIDCLSQPLLSGSVCSFAEHTDLLSVERFQDIYGTLFHMTRTNNHAPNLFASLFWQKSIYVSIFHLFSSTIEFTRNQHIHFIFNDIFVTCCFSIFHVCMSFSFRLSSFSI